MKKSYSVLVICLLFIGFVACKKDAKPAVPVAITGKWYVQKYTVNNYVNGTNVNSTTTPSGWFT